MNMASISKFNITLTTKNVLIKSNNLAAMMANLLRGEDVKYSVDKIKCHLTFIEVKLDWVHM